MLKPGILKSNTICYRESSSGSIITSGNLLYVAIMALVTALVLGSIVFFSLKRNRMINRQLAGQNEEILLQQKAQLIEMTARAKEATDAKFNFFYQYLA